MKYSKKTRFFWHFFQFWRFLQISCLYGAILAQKRNTFIFSIFLWIFWHPWDPWERIHSVQTGCVLLRPTYEEVSFHMRIFFYLIKIGFSRVHCLSVGHFGHPQSPQLTKKLVTFRVKNHFLNLFSIKYSLCRHRDLRLNECSQMICHLFPLLHSYEALLSYGHS